MVSALLISPMITPVIIAGVGMFFFYSSLGLSQTYIGIILAHAVFGAPFVVITVSVTLAGFDWTVMRAAANLGANPLVAFRRVQLPLILPGVISGSLFAFAASFDELVIVLFMGGLEQRTLPRQMWSGIREEISPTLLADSVYRTHGACSRPQGSGGRYRLRLLGCRAVRDGGPRLHDRAR